MEKRRIRLSEEEITAVKKAVINNFGSNSKVILFGSRCNSALKGGDIDLLIETDISREKFLEQKLRTKTDLDFAIGEQKIDIVVKNIGADDNRSVVIQALKKGVLL